MHGPGKGLPPNMTDDRGSLADWSGADLELLEETVRSHVQGLLHGSLSPAVVISAFPREIPVDERDLARLPMAVNMTRRLAPVPGERRWLNVWKGSFPWSDLRQHVEMAADVIPPSESEQAREGAVTRAAALATFTLLTSVFGRGG
jgi:hypothetical protein